MFNPKTLPLFLLLVSTTVAGQLDTNRIEQLTGLKGTWNAAEGVFKITQPRNDLPVSVDGWKMPPFMGLTSWAAFKAGKGQDAMVMGDLVLFEDEVNPVMSALLDAGIEVTALHNHFFYDEPRVYFMHLGGEGPAEYLATGVKLAFAKAKEIRAANPAPRHGFGGSIPSPSNIAAAPLEAEFGSKAQTKDGMVKFVMGREATMDCGCKVGADMGVNTWAAFAGTDADAVVDGDFVVRESELQTVLKSLRTSGVNIVAIHHHMTGEEPRYLFLHYWGRGAARSLAQSLKNALEVQRAVK
jgi:hypothetical protein